LRDKLISASQLALSLKANAPPRKFGTNYYMSELLSRFTFQESKLTTLIWFFTGLLWLLVVSCAIASICTQPLSKRQKYTWIALVVTVPIFGLLAYLPFSVRLDELPTAFLIRGTSKDRKKTATTRTKPSKSPRL
jgi:uncharacterized membrane protein YhaH (DUF805 family)